MVTKLKCFNLFNSPTYDEKRLNDEMSVMRLYCDDLQESGNNNYNIYYTH